MGSPRDGAQRKGSSLVHAWKNMGHQRVHWDHVYRWRCRILPCLLLEESCRAAHTPFPQSAHTGGGNEWVYMGRGGGEGGRPAEHSSQTRHPSCCARQGTQESWRMASPRDACGKFNLPRLAANLPAWKLGSDSPLPWMLSFQAGTRSTPSSTTSTGPRSSSSCGLLCIHSR